MKYRLAAALAILPSCSQAPLPPLPDDEAIQERFRKDEQKMWEQHDGPRPDTFAVFYVRGSGCEWIDLDSSGPPIAWCTFERTYSGRLQGPEENWKWDAGTALLRWTEPEWELIGYRRVEQAPPKPPLLRFSEP